MLASYAESGGAPDVDRLVSSMTGHSQRFSDLTHWDCYRTGDMAPSFSCGSLVVGTGRQERSPELWQKSARGSCLWYSGK